MTGPRLPLPPARVRRGAAAPLALVVAGALAAGVIAAGGGEGAGTDSADHGRAAGRGRDVAPAPARRESTDRAAVLDAAREAAADGKSGSQAAAEVVSRSGDRWSTVYTARQYRDFQQQLDGRYVGVGLWVRQAADGRVRVAKVGADAPAARAGVAPGDLLDAVDGSATKGRPITDVVADLRGSRAGDDAPSAAGSAVILDLRRGGRRWRVTLHRVRMRTQNVTVRRSDAPGGPTLIAVAAFAKGTGEEVRRAVRTVPAGGGVLLDLRGNSGGLVSEAVTAAAAFLDGGLVATYDVEGHQHALYAQQGRAVKAPLVVLVDSGTMSAGELLAGALQDRGRAVLVGDRTFGKGSVQLPSTLPGGSVAELTVGHYRTPSGRSVDGRGIVPDLPSQSGAEERARTVLSGLGTGA
ncbi:S41 family peptidase [Streptomyces sp. NPDC059740]|uniref:S41 family peptidase n=1 Tax=Streptomyces sp. NPDC059740 TaxID=3346926 RepID=UPI00365F3AA5